MTPLRDVPIKQKLTLISMLTTGVALVITCAAFVGYELVSFRQTLVRDITSVAEMVAYNSTSALSFSDAKSAAETLNALQAQPQVRSACIYDQHGSVFATYLAAASTMPSRPLNRGTQARFVADGLELFHPVQLDGEHVGTIYIKADLREMKGRLTRYATIALLVMSVAVLIAYAVACRLRRLISDPISSLATVARSVAVEKNYTRRAVKHGEDEVGGLIDVFNNMLAEIATRDAILEQRVAERTAALERENAERQRAEAALRESQELYHSLVEHLPLHIYRKDAEGRFTFANQRFCVFKQTTLAELLGKTVFDITPPDQAATFAAEDRTVASTGRILEVEEQHADVTGQVTHFRTVKTPVFDAAGRVAGTQGLLLDITALKQAQEHAARERARLQFIFESVPVGISLTVVQRGQRTSRLINQAHLQICGLTREQANDQGVFGRMTHPDDYQRQKACMRQIDTGELERYALEKRYLTPDRGVVWVVYTMQRRQYSDGTCEDLSTLVDITELKKAQEEAAREQARFKFIFESLPVGVTWMHNDDLSTRIVNPAHARISGVPMSARHEIQRYRETTHPDDRTRQDELHRRLTSGEIDHYQLEKRYLHPDGSIRWAVLSMRQLRNGTADHAQVIGTLVDITDRKQVEAEREAMNRQLLEISRQAGMAEVATGVLHNVGNVLNSVNVSATVVIDQVRESKTRYISKIAGMFTQHAHDLASFVMHDPKGRQIPAYLESLAAHVAAEHTLITDELQALRKNIEHIKDIVTMQQSYAKISGISETVALADLVEDAFRLNAGALVRHGVEVVRDFAINPVLVLEKHKVLQILVNLIRNAKYACDDGGAARKIITVRITGHDGSVRIDVADNGIGIPRENLTRIFAHGFTTRAQGHGFGLHSGALAAKELGGSLTAHSDGVGCGATFTLELPLSTDALSS